MSELMADRHRTCLGTGSQALPRLPRLPRPTFWHLLIAVGLTAAAGCGSNDAQPSAAGTASEAAGADSPHSRAVPTGNEADSHTVGGLAGALAPGVVVHYPTDQNNHVTGEVAYEARPPTGGDHFDFWQNCFFYTEPVKDELAVHSLEHGAVWVAYQPDIEPAILEAVKSRADSETHLMASPYPGLEWPLVLSAWERQMAAENWNDPAVEDFLSSYLGRNSPTAPEAGAACSDSIGDPGNPNLNYEEALEYALKLREDDP